MDPGPAPGTVAAPSTPLLVVGMNHRTAPARVRESLAFGQEEAVSLLARGLREGAWTEALLLSTCNRTELYAVPEAPGRGRGELEARLAAARPGAAVPADGCFYRAGGGDAVRHLFRVACGLDSMVLGESEIAGQLRAAHRASRAAGTAGPMLDHVVPAALRTAVRAREETGIHRGVTSMPAAALALARRHVGDLSRARVLILGAGEAGRIGARLFSSELPRALLVADRTPSRSVALAEETRASALDWSRLEWAIDRSDVVLTAVGAAGPILTRACLQAASLRRRGARLVVIDIGIPRNVDPNGRDVNGIVLLDSDDIGALIERNREHRRMETGKVEALVEEGLGRVLRCVGSPRPDPLVSMIRRSLEDLRVRELERSRPHFSPEQWEHLDRLTRSLLDKAYHAPMRVLGEPPPPARDDAWVRRLFGVESPPPIPPV